jgi:hypothetical protein
MTGKDKGYPGGHAEICQGDGPDKEYQARDTTLAKANIHQGQAVVLVQEIVLFETETTLNSEVYEFTIAASNSSSI